MALAQFDVHEVRDALEACQFVVRRIEDLAIRKARMLHYNHCDDFVVLEVLIVTGPSPTKSHGDSPFSPHFATNLICFFYNVMADVVGYYRGVGATRPGSYQPTAPTAVGGARLAPNSAQAVGVRAPAGSTVLLSVNDRRGGGLGIGVRLPARHDPRG